MLDLLPLDILIIIINKLSYVEIDNLIKLNIPTLIEASKHIKKISLFNTKNINIDFWKKLKYPEIIKIFNYNENYDIIKLMYEKEWQLRELKINSYNSLCHQLLKHFLMKQTKLEKLNFMNKFTLFRDEHLKVITPKLKALNLINCVIDINNLNRFEELESLYLHHPTITTNIDNFHQLKLTNLKRFSINNFMSHNDYDEIFNFIINNPKLVEIEFICATYIMLSIQKLNHLIPKLEKLSISSTLLDNIPLQHIWYNLKSVNFSCSNLNDFMYYSIIDSAPNLKDIIVNFTNITDLSVIYTINKNSKIRNLGIAHNKGVTNLSIIQISYFCHDLESLDICNIKTNNFYINNIIKNNNNLHRLLLVNHNYQNKYPRLRTRDNLLII